MESALCAGKTLHEDLGIFMNQYRHTIYLGIGGKSREKPRK
jgi:hypothetical protein